MSFDIKKFYSLDYLSTGTMKQRAAYKLIRKYRLWKILHPFSPLLAGTIPLDIDIETSDLDILCCSQDFAAITYEVFSHLTSAQIQVIHSQDRLVIRFELGAFPIEIYTEKQASEMQNGFVHMLVEARLLHLGGEALKQEIRTLKQEGYNTEHAFTHALNLKGDPFKVLYDLSQASDQMLENLMQEKLDQWALTPNLNN